jgi:hypothetical protein
LFLNTSLPNRCEVISHCNFDSKLVHFVVCKLYLSRFKIDKWIITVKDARSWRLWGLEILDCHEYLGMIIFSVTGFSLSLPGLHTFSESLVHLFIHSFIW